MMRQLTVDECVATAGGCYSCTANSDMFVMMYAMDLPPAEREQFFDLMLTLHSIPIGMLAGGFGTVAAIGLVTTSEIAVIGMGVLGATVGGITAPIAVAAGLIWLRS